MVNLTLNARKFTFSVGKEKLLMRFRIFTALLVVSVALVGWPGMGRTCGMSCCAPGVGAEVQLRVTQLKAEAPGCCCCEDGRSGCNWESATHQREPMALHSTESYSELLRTARVVTSAFLQILPFPKDISFGRSFWPPTGPPVTTDLTVLYQVVLC
jgi:hypothetical protein